MINNLGYVFCTVYAACVDKFKETIHPWRYFLSSLALSRRIFSARGGGGAFATFAPPPLAYAPGSYELKITTAHPVLTIMLKNILFEAEILKIYLKGHSVSVLIKIKFSNYNLVVQRIYAITVYRSNKKKIIGKKTLSTKLLTELFYKCIYYTTLIVRGANQKPQCLDLERVQISCDICTVRRFFCLV